MHGENLIFEEFPVIILFIRSGRVCSEFE